MKMAQNTLCTVLADIKRSVKGHTECQMIKLDLIKSLSMVGPLISLLKLFKRKVSQKILVFVPTNLAL